MPFASLFSTSLRTDHNEWLFVVGPEPWREHCRIPLDIGSKDNGWNTSHKVMQGQIIGNLHIEQMNISNG